MIPVPPADLPNVEEAVAEALTSWVTESCAAAKVEIRFLGIRKEVLQDGIRFLWAGHPCQSNPRLNLSVVRESGEASTLVVRPALTLWVHTPVAAKNVQTGQLVQPVLGLVDLSKISGSPLPAGGEARVPIREGQPITTMNTRKPFDGRSGDSIRIEVQRGNIQLTSPGRLLTDARVGDEVRVINHHTKVVLTGVLDKSGTVRIP